MVYGNSGNIASTGHIWFTGTRANSPYWPYVFFHEHFISLLLKRNTVFTIHCLEQLFTYTVLAYEVLTDITVEVRFQNARVTMAHPTLTTLLERLIHVGLCPHAVASCIGI